MSENSSDSLSDDHRQLLLRLMSKGLEARSSDEAAGGAAAAQRAASNRSGLVWTGQGAQRAAALPAVAWPAHSVAGVRVPGGALPTCLA